MVPLRVGIRTFAEAGCGSGHRANSLALLFISFDFYYTTDFDILRGQFKKNEDFFGFEVYLCLRRSIYEVLGRPGDRKFFDFSDPSMLPIVNLNEVARWR